MEMTGMISAPAGRAAADDKERTLDESFADLESIIAKMESGELSLEQSFVMYETGMRLLKECKEKIDLVEKQVMQISESGELNEF